MPAAAVIPAPIAYIKVVAVKKLVVGLVSHAVGSSPVDVTARLCEWDVQPVGRQVPLMTGRAPGRASGGVRTASRKRVCVGRAPRSRVRLGWPAPFGVVCGGPSLKGRAPISCVAASVGGVPDPCYSSRCS